MQLNDLYPAPGSRKDRKRVGRGNSGYGGTTAGRGQKGQKSRSGGGKGPGFEGGQMKLAMRLPKLPGFRNPTRVEYAPVNLARLDALFNDGDVVDNDALVAKNVIKKSTTLVKVLGDGDITKKLTVKVDKVSASAQAKIEAAGGEGRASVLTAILNAFRVPELRKKILFTLGIIVLYRIGSYIPLPGIPFGDLVSQFEDANGGMANTMALLNLFAGGALSYVSLFSLGIMPYITASIILQMMQAVIPSLRELAKEGETGQRKITQYTRYLTIVLSLVNAIGYLLLFKSPSYGISFAGMGVPEALMDVMIVFGFVVGSVLIMWLGELITQHGVGNGMSLIIFANIMSRLPQAIFSSVEYNSYGELITILVIIVILVVIPPIIFIERGQRRIPIQYAKRVVGRRMMGGQTTYLPIKVNTAGVIPIIFASSLLYIPAQLAVFFPNVEWIQVFSNAVSAGWLNWLLSFALIIFFAYFYTAMVFNPEDTADNLRKQGGFIPGVRPGAATARYIKDVLNRITLPGAIFIALIAVVPSILFYFTDNTLIQAFGGTSILIMVGVALDTMSKVESQLKMHDYGGFFK